MVVTVLALLHYQSYRVKRSAPVEAFIADGDALYQENPDDDDLRGFLLRAQVGDSLEMGGGAAPVVIIERIE